MSDEQSFNLFRRGLRAFLRAGATLFVTAIAMGLVLWGSNTLAQRAEADTITSIAEPLPVQVRPIEMRRGFTLSRQFVGQVEASKNVTLSFERSGQLEAILVVEGQRVFEGDVLARLDTALLEAEQQRLEASQAATRAQADFAESRLTRAVALQSDGFASTEAVDQARANRDELIARLDEIAAALHSVQINLEKSEITAAFDGRIGLTNVDGQEALAAGSPVLTLVQTDAPEIRVGLPLSVTEQMLQSATVRIRGDEFVAELLQIRPDIDPVTRTRTAIFALQTDQPIVVGETATLILDQAVAATGTWVPLDALQEGQGGAWSILTVDDEIVRHALVEVLHTEPSRAFVRGTFAADALLIETGAHRVVPGQRVRVLQSQG
ncbi:efflux RND transporter periplasmic adaptor subunit [Yoonia litorea]|nr:efflux RND transporter periplasmic adaptor subunit [Yoonia litorea]